jgi:hypothetical protein
VKRTIREKEDKESEKSMKKVVIKDGREKLKEENAVKDGEEDGELLRLMKKHTNKVFTLFYFAFIFC